jgi:hypothetical protein
MAGKAEGGVKGEASRAFAHAPYAACAAGAPRGPREGSDARSGLRPAAVFLSLTYAQAPSPPRPVSGLAISKNWEAGRVVRATLFYFKARPPRPAGAFAPDGWAGLVPAVPPCSRRSKREDPTELTGQTFTEARTCGGSVPTKPRYRCATDPDTVTLPECPVRIRVPARTMRELCRSGQGAWTKAKAGPAVEKRKNNQRIGRISRKRDHELNAGLG